MGKKWPPPVHLKEVVYMLSPFELKVMSGLWKNFWPSLKSSVHEHRSDPVVFITPIVGTVAYAKRYEEKEKLEERY